MPSMALHSYFWEEQAAAPPGPVLTAFSRYLGPPLVATMLALSLCGIEGLFGVLL